MTPPLLIDQQAALIGFLDDLLAEDGQETDIVSAESAEESGLNTDVESVMPAEEKLAPEQPESAEVALPAAIDADKSLAQVINVDDGRTPILPDWGLQPFQAMIFKVGELSLAIPLTELVGVIEWRPEPLEGASDDGICLGYYPHEGQLVSVMDMAKLVFAGSQYGDLSQAEPCQRITRIILINDMKWGLAVDVVHEVRVIQPTRVNWRSTRTRRQWLAGTMLDEMVVVLDARSTAKILSEMFANME